MLIAVILMVTLSISGACPPWTTYISSSDQCQCGDSLGGVVRCDRETLNVSVLSCYCITYNNCLNQTLMGQCATNCDADENFYFNITTADVYLLNNVTCQHFKRTGQLCGKCVKGYGPPVYSYSLNCVECSESHSKHNLLRYIAIAFGPLTLFYLVVIVFKISVTSGSMTAYVMIIQIVAEAASSRILLTRVKYSSIISAAIEINAFWNLDILRSVYTPFCIHPKMTPLQVLALDYLVGVYPLFLIFLTYIAVSLHDRYSLVVKMWRPAYKCLSYFRREWDIRGSLVQAFASFLVLSYVKILKVSFGLLTPVYLRTMESKYLEQLYLYNDGEVPYFGREHLSYGVLAIIMLTVFNILPGILLLAYPCKCFQKCLNCCKLHSHTLHTFMDAFQGCYRHCPRDCRYFSTVYLFFRVLSLLTFSYVKYKETCVAMCGFYFITLALFLLHQKPYKKKVHNKINTTLVLFAAFVAFTYSMKYQPISEATLTACHAMRTIGIIIFSLFMVYGIVLCLSHFLPKKLCTRARNYCNFVYTSILKKGDTTANDVEESLPHRIHHQDEYSPLIQAA